MAKVSGKKIETKKYKCRFPEIHQKNEKGQFQIEILVPKEDVKELNAQLYGGNTKLINMNKPSPKAKMPKSLHSPLYQYNAEDKEYIYDDETGEKLHDEKHVVYRFKSQFPPQILFKKGLDKTANVGFDSVVQIAGKVFTSNEGKDESGKSLKFTLLTLLGVKVHELVVSEGQSAFEEDDGFEQAEGTVEAGYEEAPDMDEHANSEAPDMDEHANKSSRKKENF